MKSLSINNRTPVYFTLLVTALLMLAASPGDASAQTVKPKKGRSKAIGVEAAPMISAKDHKEVKRFALIIGINDYADKKIPDLATCENDAKAMHRLLTNQQVGGVDKNSAVLLLGKSATTRQIKKQLAKLRLIPAESTIYIYFSGHGAKEADEAFWVTHDSEIDALAASGLADREVRAFLERIPSKRVVVMIDACYAAATIKGGKALTNDFSPILKQFTGKGTAFLMAAGSGEEAIEAEDLKHSVFTHYLVKGLSGKADTNGDGVVVLPELTTYIDQHVAEEARIRGGIQRPVVSLVAVQEPAKFSLSIDPERLRRNQQETEKFRNMRDLRLKLLKQLALESKLTVQQYRLGERLISTTDRQLSDLDLKRKAEFVAVVDGKLPPEKLALALQLVGPDATPATPTNTSTANNPPKTNPFDKPPAPGPTQPKPPATNPFDKPPAPTTPTPTPPAPTPPTPAPSPASTPAATDGDLAIAMAQLNSIDKQIAEAMKTHRSTSPTVKGLQKTRQAYQDKHRSLLTSTYRKKHQEYRTLIRTVRSSSPQAYALRQELIRLRSLLTTTNSLGMKLVYIPSGTFIMGSPESEDDRDDDESQHRVSLTKDFYMGSTEVTQAQWKSLMGANPSDNVGDNLPVDNVSWEQAMAFCDRLSAREGRKYTLPTEAQWEYACRAGSTTPWYSGSTSFAAANAGWNSDNSDDRTQTVGRRGPNAWGLYDMHGNLWEWCLDRYGDYPRSSVTDPTGTGTDSSRVLRGGSWDDDPDETRAANRDEADQDSEDNEHGFRVILVPN